MILSRLKRSRCEYSRHRYSIAIPRIFAPALRLRADFVRLGRGGKRHERGNRHSRARAVRSQLDKSLCSLSYGSIMNTIPPLFRVIYCPEENSENFREILKTRTPLRHRDEFEDSGMRLKTSGR